MSIFIRFQHHEPHNIEPKMRYRAFKLTFPRKYFLGLLLFICTQLFNSSIVAQMRQMYVDLVTTNHISKISFFSPSQGYIAFRDWIGYTTDSGRTFTRKYITVGNVNYNGYPVNWIFGFNIGGVKAFNQSTIIAYGDYSFEPSILYSTDGGNSYTVVYHSTQLNTGMKDMIFPQNSNIGYAVDADRILKTTNGGLSWNITRNDPGSFFDHLEATDDNNVFAIAAQTNKLLRTSNAGASWQPVPLPAGSLSYANFITPLKGWLCMSAPTTGTSRMYYTSNGGVNWRQMTNDSVTAFGTNKMKFINDSTGYAFYLEYATYKTTDSAKTWEPLPRDNNFIYASYFHNEIHFWNNSQFWAGGLHGFLEMTTNGGGTPLPKAYFKIDTTNLSVTNTINLINFSKTTYQYKWFRNNVLFSTSYHASYTRDPFKDRDTIKLVVLNGSYTDTLEQYLQFFPSVTIYSFTPTSGPTGGLITINGQTFLGINSVKFGGVPASSFTVVNQGTITATIGAGATGDITVAGPYGSASKPGFTYIGPPTIASFTPTSQGSGGIVTITGTNFSGATAVSFGGSSSPSFTVVNSTTITAQVGVGASGNVSVTTPGGTASLAGFTFIPIATISRFTPIATGTGGIVTITGTNFLGTTSVRFGGTPASSFTVVSSNTITAVVGSGASGTVQVTTAAGSTFLSGFYFTSQPIINSISPLSGPVGTTVTITGANFVAGVANNRVYFGPVSTAPLSVSANTITVVVPPGATYGPITVTANNLVTYSLKPFIVTFPGGSSFTSTTFSGRTDFEVGVNPTDIATGDFDGDGKPDIAATNFSNHTVSVLRNTTTGGVLSFATKITLTAGLHPHNLAIGDMDGDGKLDIVFVNSHPNGSASQNTVSILRNLSSPGNIAFAQRITQETGFIPGDVAIVDLNMDNKPDLAITNSGNENMWVYTNTSTGGNVTFSGPQIFNLQNGPDLHYVTDIIAADLDSDEKIDLVIGKSSSYYHTYAKNGSFPGSTIGMAINFSPNFGGSGRLANISAADFDGDNKPDIVGSGGLFRNTSNAFGISFSLQSSSVGGVGSINDLNGDGQPDFEKVTASSSLVTAFRNTSTQGIFSFAPGVTYLTGNNPKGTISADFDLDGKPDIGTANYDINTVSILKNTFGYSGILISSFSPGSGTTGTVVTINGSNFTGATSVSFGGVTASSFTVISPTTIVAVVGTGSSGNVTVVSPAGTISLAGFIYVVPAPTITSFTPTTGPAGTVVTITGTNFGSPATVTFGGVHAASFTINSSTSITAVLGTAGASGNVSVTTPGGTASLAGFVYLYIPVVSSFTPTSGQSGTNVTIFGNNFNGTTSVKFGGTNATSFNVITNIVMSARVGPGSTGNITVTNSDGTGSSSGTFTYVVVTAINPVPASSYGIKFYPNPVSATLIIDSLKLSDKWLNVDIIQSDGKQVLPAINISNKKRAEINVVRLSVGSYMAIIRRNNGAPVTLHFIKL